MHTLSSSQWVKTLRPQTTVYLPGVSGESLAIYKALQGAPESAAGVRFVGMHFPGINRSDYLGLHAQARQRAYFMLPGLRAGLASGRGELMPLDHPRIYRDLAGLEVDVAVVQVSPPDEKGFCSPGLSYDFHPAVWSRARQRLAHVNPDMPKTRGSFRIHVSELDVIIDEPSPLVQLSEPADAADDRLRRQAALVAELVRDGDTIEFGVGKLPAAIAAALVDHRNLRIWSGMIASSVLTLLDSGAVHGEASVEGGVALGEAALYDRVSRDDAFYFRPVNETHDVARLMRIERFCAINSAIEVDLFGQANADMIKGRYVAGVGGLPAFAAGASLSPGGRSIIVLPAATDDGRFSRVVLNVGKQAMAALPRHAADTVVTEYGVAELGGLSLHERARAMIRIAAPQFRDELERTWSEMRDGL